MNIPKYVIDMMNRSEFVLGEYEPGYTIRIKKSTPYTKIDTLVKEVRKLQKWIERLMPEDEVEVPTIVVNYIPSKTHYCNQSAIVTIYDPVMMQLEKHIKGGV